MVRAIVLTILLTIISMRPAYAGYVFWDTTTPNMPQWDSVTQCIEAPDFLTFAKHHRQYSERPQQRSEWTLLCSIQPEKKQMLCRNRAGTTVTTLWFKEESACQKSKATWDAKAEARRTAPRNFYYFVMDYEQNNDSLKTSSPKRFRTKTCATVKTSPDKLSDWFQRASEKFNLTDCKSGMKGSITCDHALTTDYRNFSYFLAKSDCEEEMKAIRRNYRLPYVAMGPLVARPDAIKREKPTVEASEPDPEVALEPKPSPEPKEFNETLSESEGEANAQRETTSIPATNPAADATQSAADKE